MPNIHSIEAEVLGVKDNVFRIKISVLDLGLYMFGFRAKQSDRSPGGWWIQPPATNIAGIWKPNPEFDKKQTLWHEIENSCIDAVTSYSSGIDEVYIPEDDELSDEAITNNLNKAIPWLNEDKS